MTLTARGALSAAVAASALFAAAPASAAVTIYTNETAFNAVVDEVVEDFNDATLVPGLSYTSSAGMIQNNYFYDVAAGNTSITTFTFASPTTAFGGIFNLSPRGVGQGLRFFIDGVQVPTEIARIAGNQFFGFTSTTAFSSVRIEGGSGTRNTETYYVDDLRFAATTAGVVPEPATWGMLILGFGAVGGALRRRKQVASVTFG